MQRLKVVLTLEIKADPEDVDMVEQEIRDELAGLLESEEDLNYRLIEEESEEEDEGYLD